MIIEQPCEHCDDIRTEAETGAGYCAATSEGFFECEEALAVGELSEFAGQVSRLICNILSREDRDTLADGVCSAIHDACYAHGVRFKEDVFLEWCNTSTDPNEESGQ